MKTYITLTENTRIRETQLLIFCFRYIMLSQKQKIIIGLSLAVIIILLISAYLYARGGSQLISSERARELISDGAIPIDIRTSFEYKMGHAEGAIHIPLAKLTKEKMDTMDKKKVYIVYCNSGQRARVGAERMAGNGFSEVYYIAGTHTSL